VENVKVFNLIGKPMVLEMMNAVRVVPTNEFAMIRVLLEVTMTPLPERRTRGGGGGLLATTAGGGTAFVDW
jgi:hypothetical protein